MLDLPMRHIQLNNNYFNIPPFINPKLSFNYQFKIFRNIHKSTQQPYAMNFFPLTAITPFCTDPYDSDNLMLGYRKRISPVRPQVNLLLINQLGLFVQNWLESNLQPLPFLENQYDALFEQWMEENNSYTSDKKNMMRDVKNELKLRLNMFLMTEKDLLCKSFPKREFYEVEKFLRLINSRSNFFKVLVGPFIHLLEKVIYNLKWFAKGIDPMEMPNEISKLSKYTVYVETDYSSYESSFDPYYMDNVECRLWRYMFANNPHLLKAILSSYYIEDQGVIKPRTQVMIGSNYVAKAVGARMSGEMWTSLGNGFSNLMNMLFICHNQNVECDGFVEGDDGLFGMNSDFITVNHFTPLGFVIKMKKAFNLEDTDFCGNIFSSITHHSLLSPEQIVRLTWTCSTKYFRCSDSVQEELLRCKAQSCYVQGKYTPILGPLSLKIIQLLGQGAIRFETSNEWWDRRILKMLSREQFQPVNINIEDRMLYARRFSIPIDLQLDLEKIIAEATSMQQLYLPGLMAVSYESGYMSFN